MRELTAVGSRIVVGPGALDRLGELAGGVVQAHRAAIVTDTNVGPLYAARAAAALSALSPVVVTIPAGEANKTRDAWAHITDELLAHGLARDAVIVALGGGVIGDIAGFTAATYMRGVPVIQVPTSLMAMIDAAIGGKTAVDVPAGKNLVGAFHPPALVLVDADLLSTLPVRELRSGFAEALKHGAVADADYFARMAATAPTFVDAARAEHSEVRDLVARSIEIKAAIVDEDLREHGRRKVLNFGHTLGHAIEAASGYTLRHGEAIAIGMVLEARLGESLGVTARGTGDAIERAARSAGLPVSTTLDPASLVARTQSDKKKAAGQVEYSLPAAIGSFAAWSRPVSDADVLRCLSAAGLAG